MNYIKTKFLTTYLFLLVLAVSVNVQAQAPGGVKNPVLWENTWEANSQEEHGNPLFNYHPYKFFNEDRGYSELPLKGLKKMSLFVVFSSDRPTEIGRINTGRGEVILTDTTVVSRRSIPYEKVLKPKFISYIESFPGGNITLKDQPHFMIGSKEVKDNWYEGGIAEVIMYDRLISKTQRQKIESYLSIKYGISLPDTSNYLRSDGAKIRVGKGHPKYKHNVTGIGRDDAGGLLQKQSHNLYSDIDLTIGLGQLSDMNKKNANAIENHSYLIWADDNGPSSFKKKKTVDTKRTVLGRKWELSIIGDDIKNIPMTVKLDASAIAEYNPNEKLWLVVSNSDVGILEDSATDYFEMKKSKEGMVAQDVYFDKNESGMDYISFVQMPDILAEIENRNLVSDVLYPNPVGSAGEFTLSLSGYEDTALTVSIYDVTGQMVRHQEFDTGKTFVYQDKLKLPGAYMVKVEGEKTNVSYKLIVQ